MPLREALDALALSRKHVARRLEEGAREFRLGVADWDMKGSDARRLVERFDAIADVVRSSGLPAITDHLDRGLDELIAVRRQPDRGVVDNFPFWKLLILAAWLGWWIVLLVVCSAFGCSPTVGVFWTLINISHLLFFVLFC